MSSLRTSISCTAAAVLLGVASLLWGRRVNYLDHLTWFNLLAACMLGLVVVGLVAATIPLIRARGRGGSLWGAAAFAVLILGSFLLDD